MKEFKENDIEKLNDVDEILLQQKLITCSGCNNNYPFIRDSCPNCRTYNLEKDAYDEAIRRIAGAKFDKTLNLIILTFICFLLGTCIFLLLTHHPLAAFLLFTLPAIVWLMIHKSGQARQPGSGTLSAIYTDGEHFSNVNSALICIHCQTKGSVSTKSVNRKQGISGAKATGAILTGGFSLLATGLSRKEKMTEAHCGNCGSKWVF